MMSGQQNVLLVQIGEGNIRRVSLLGVDQNELTQHIFQRAQQSGQNPDEFARHMVEHNHIPEMVSEVVRGKALATIVDTAKVTDESGSHVELKLLQPDGTIGEPVEETDDAAVEAVGDSQDEESAKTDEA